MHNVDDNSFFNSFLGVAGGGCLMSLFVVLLNLAALAGGVWVVVEVLQWTGVL